MHPRVSHEVLRYSGLDQNDAVVLEAEMVETAQEVLEDNSDKETGWFDEKLFNLGYRNLPKSPNLRKLRRRPYSNHVSDRTNITSIQFSNPYSQGKKKSESNFHYYWANNFLIQDMAEQEIVLE